MTADGSHPQRDAQATHASGSVTGNRRAIGPADLAGLGVAVGLFGLSFGLMAATLGFSAWSAAAMSALVLAGGAQFAAIAVLGAGGTEVAAVSAGLLLNLRFAPLGLAIAPALPRRTATRACLSHLVGDHSVAAALVHETQGVRRRTFLSSGLVIFVTWTAGTALGAIGGEHLAEPHQLGLDAALPAGFLALLLPHVRRRRTLAAALAGGASAALLGPLLPAGLPVLLAASIGTAAALCVPNVPAESPTRPR